MKYKFNFSSINLWCNKNLVDTQFLMWRVLGFSWLNSKYEINYFADVYDEIVDFVFLNTCGFLSSWRDEMIQCLQSLIDAKKKVFVLWCGVQYFQNLTKEDRPKILKHTNVKFISWQDLDKITIHDLITGYSSKRFDDFSFPINDIRAYTNSVYWFEYIKIAEGCNNSCSFCIIPKIRWKQKSLSIEKISEQAENLLQNGVQEIILLSQDSTRYWIDLYKNPALIRLLQKLDDLNYDFNYRVLYLYPDIVTLKHLDKFKKLKKFLPYFDIPLQHISSDVLKRMGRFYDSDYIKKFLGYLKINFDSCVVRTNIIVGFPGETDKDFEELVEFIEKTDFDNISLFEYHDEPVSSSFKLSEKIPDSLIRDRFAILKKIVDEKLEQKYKQRKCMEQIGYVVDITGDESSTIVVRPYLYAPEIDPYDEILLSQVKWVFGENWDLEIWKKIIYEL